MREGPSGEAGKRAEKKEKERDTGWGGLGGEEIVKQTKEGRLETRTCMSAGVPGEKGSNHGLVLYRVEGARGIGHQPSYFQQRQATHGYLHLCTCVRVFV